MEADTTHTVTPTTIYIHTCVVIESCVSLYPCSVYITATTAVVATIVVVYSQAPNASIQTIEIPTYIP